jgi:hypothetical protein
MLTLDSGVEDPTPHYQALARSAAAVCGAGFKRAQIIATIDDGYAEIVYHCDLPGGRKEGADSSFEDDRAVSDALHALRDATPGRPKWSHATFVVAEDGTFAFEVGDED